MNFKSLISNIQNGHFVQIGAYDGLSNDDFGLKDKLFDENHTAILIEPIPEYFNNLVLNYELANSKVFFENLAISNKKEVRKIQIKGQDTSFVRKFDTPTNTMDIRCETFNYIIDKYNISKIDALVIDTEAYELVILESIMNTVKIPIDIIRYEFVHLSNQDSSKLEDILLENGYDIFQDETSYADKIAIKKIISNENKRFSFF